MEDDSNSQLVGRPVRKFFRGHGYYTGTVLSYDRARKLFRVKYADGDREELELREVQEILVHGSPAPAKRPRGRPRKHPLPPVTAAAAENKTANASVDHGELIQAENGHRDNHGTLHGKRKREDEDEGGEASELKKRCVEEGGLSKVMKSASPPHRRKAGLMVYPLRRAPVEVKRVEVMEKEEQQQQQQPVEEKTVVERDLNIPPLPPSAVSMSNLPMEAVADLFSVFAFLRSFSWVVFLSPFTLPDFVSCLTITDANPLFDQIHLSLLLLLRQQLENLANDGDEAAMICLKSRDWNLLDGVTWPSYLVAYLLNEDCKVDGKVNLPETRILKGEYYTLEVGIKIRILSFVCDRLLDTEEVRSELAKRTNEDQEVDLSELKTPLAKTVSSEACDSERRTRTRKGSPSETSELDDPVVVVPEQQGVAVDWNSDDCVLCGMDGNLICCDGCPGAYHSRCVGVSRITLPEGDWFCPECTLQRSGVDGSRPRKVLRGFEYLGADTFGRRYVAVCEHLFISESSGLDAVQVCYGPSDVPSCLEVLESTGALSSDLRTSIMQHWKISGESNAEASGSPEKNQVLPDTSSCMQNTVGTEPRFQPCAEKKNGPIRLDETAWGVYNYVNHYAWGASAASAASRLAERSGNRKLCVQKAQIFEQVKAFSEAPALFYWPSFKKKHMEAPKDRCGWCFACKNLSRKKGCLLNTAAAKISAGAAIVGGGLRPTKKGFNHLPALAAYLLHMEERLNGLLVGAWENVEHRKWWRKLVETAQSVRQLRRALVEFGLSLRPLALSRNWSALAEDAPRLVPLSQLPANGYVAPRGRRRKYFPEGEPVTFVQWWRGGKVARKFQDWETLPAASLRRAARQGGVKRLSVLMYSDNSDVPRRAAKCAWVARVESSFSVSELAIQVRHLDALIRWTDLSVPEEARALLKDSLISERTSEGSTFKYYVTSSRTENELAGLLTPDIAFSAPKFIKVLAGEDADESKGQVWLLDTQVPLCLVREFEENRRIRMLKALEEKRRIEMEEKKRIEMEERRREYEAKRREYEEKKRLELQERRRLEVQMKAVKSPGPGRKASQADITPKVPKTNKFKIVVNKPNSANSGAKMAVMCEHCNLDLAPSDRVCCEECQGDFHERCMVSGKKSIDPMCQSCFSVKQSKRSRKPSAKTTPAAEPDFTTVVDKTRAAGKTLQVYSRRRTQKPLASNAYTGVAVVRKKRSNRPSNTGVRWKTETRFTLNEDRVVYPAAGDARAPRCGVCHRAYDSSLLYVGCEHCEEWYHGSALGITSANIDQVLSFKCHKCRKKAPPLCPFQQAVSSFVPQIVI